MDAKIRHDSHNRFVLIKKPCAFPGVYAPSLRPAVPESGTESKDIPYFPRVYHPLCLPVRTGKSLVLVNHQNPVILSRSSHHRFAVRQCHRHRFFAKHMFSCLQCRYGDGCVYTVSRAHRHRINGIIRQQFLIRVINLCLILFRKLPCPFLIDVIKPADSGVLIRLIFRNMPDLRNLAAPYYANIYHRTSSSLSKF